MNHPEPTHVRAETDRTGWSAKSSKFFDHWMALRAGMTFPASHNFLDSCEPEIQPQIFLFEHVAPHKTVFRLMATELVTIWGKDFTGLAIEEVFSPTVAQRYLADPWDCHSLSCGLWEQGQYGDTRERVVTLELMYLPLSTPPDKPARLAGILAWTGLSTERASRLGLISIKERRWVDTGYGIPSTPPDIFSV